MLRSLAQALEIEEIELQQDQPAAISETDEVEIEAKEEDAPINYSYIKIINLSSLIFTLLPPLNIFVPLILMHSMKQRNSPARQIISVQMIWTVMAPITFMLGIF